ncbi:ARM repeat-containing protein [Mycena sanguinolenta]|uniref:ARM repeat-containing protein n=1 Tax=Mycena sanguinolenta TaxID=230812 RepID=A0A8H6XHY4_9AGAR|nr:ARM repeat-containing protein [Mycena sanguinolenta]
MQHPHPHQPASLLAHALYDHHPLYDHSSPPRAPPPPSAAAAPSIWAPQPQANEAAWPRALEAFSRAAVPEAFSRAAVPATITRAREDIDVFGPLAALGVVGDRRGVNVSLGASRTGSASPDIKADIHVEQLLRTLNLNSPEPMPAPATPTTPAARSSPGSASGSARSVHSVRSGGSAHSIHSNTSSGKPKPTPLTLDFSFASSNSGASATSASASASFNADTSSSNTSNTTSSSNLSSASSLAAASSLAQNLSSTSEGDSLPSLPTGSGGTGSYPQSPDFSPLSFSSALLTPLDSPHGLGSPHTLSHGNAQLVQLSPTHALHSLSPVRSTLHSPMHSPTHNLNSPTHAHGLYSPGGHGLHSPGGYFHNKERGAYAYDPPSPYGLGHGHGLLGSPGARLPSSLGLGFNNANDLGTAASPNANANANATATANANLDNGRFLPLPPTPPSLPSLMLTSHAPSHTHAHSQFGSGLGGARVGEDAAYYHARGLSSGGLDYRVNVNASASSGMSANMGAGTSDWMRADDGLGLELGPGLGLGQGRGLGLGYGQTGSTASGGGSAVLERTMFGGGGMGLGSGGGAALYADEGVGVGRASFAYQQQQLQLQQQQLEQQLQLRAQRQQVEAQQQQLEAQQRAQQVQQQQLQQQQDALGLGLAAFGGGGKVWDTGVGAGNAGAGVSGAGSSGEHGQGHGARERRASSSGNEPINFLSLLHPSSSPPYAAFVARIIKSADQQASIFLQQKLKVAGVEERGRIVDAICARGGEMMMHRFGNWAVQRCLEAATGAEERRKIVACMRGRVVDLATNCYGCHVLQKALDCEEEEVRLLIVSELLMGDPAQTLVNKHASHVWSKIMELSWTPPAPPIFAYVNKALKGKWAALACHETGSLVVQHAFENLEESAKDGIVQELLGQGTAVFGEVAKSQWGSYCIQHILEHGSDKHRQMALDHLLTGLLEFATNEQGSKSVVKALKEGGKETLDRVVQRMCEPAKGARRAMIVDLALSLTGSQLIASVLPTVDKDQRALLYDCIRGHIVTLRGCKTGSKVIWLFDRMRAYYGY